MPLTPDYAGFVGIGYLCNQCGNYVALRYGNQRIQPDIVLSVRWNSALRTRAKLLDGDLGFATCGSEKDYLTLHALQVLAKAEEPSFAFGNPREYKAALFFRTTEDRYTGYIAWTEETNAILRQIFVVKEQRRKGYAKITLRFWATTYAEPFGRPFGIESPNEKTLGLLVALGYAKNTSEGFRINRDRCYAFVAM